jgi:hypothetical protein
MLRVQRLIPRVAPRLLAPSLRAMERKRFIDWSFGHYLNVAHPDFVTGPGSHGSAAARYAPAAA